MFDDHHYIVDIVISGKGTNWINKSCSENLNFKEVVEGPLSIGLNVYLAEQEETILKISPGSTFRVKFRLTWGNPPPDSTPEDNRPEGDHEEVQKNSEENGFSANSLVDQ